jgi:hypothetical protein
MEQIIGEIRTHIERRNRLTFDPLGSGRRIAPDTTQCFGGTSNAQIRASLGYPVNSFRELVGYVAEVGSANPHLNLYYRGQKTDWLDRNGRSKIYPGLYRPKPGKLNLHPSTITKRIELMECAIERMKANHRNLRLPETVLADHDEYYQALLQHYERCPTPLVDVTVSLRVAASFALANDAEEAFLYLVHLPLPTGSISHFIDQNIVLVRLQSVCSPRALRPHFQEWFLVGQLRHKARKQVGDNLAKRLVGKYRLVNPGGRFWSRDFPPIPANALLPQVDPFGSQLADLLMNIELNE